MPARTGTIPFVIDLKTGTARSKDRLSGRVDLTFTARAYGGNLDYKEIREAVTVLLPVSVAGDYVFLADGSAFQGDGEAVGSGLRPLSTFSTCNSQLASKERCEPKRSRCDCALSALRVRYQYHSRPIDRRNPPADLFNDCMP